jgi:hypothetical protein
MRTGTMGGTGTGTVTRWGNRLGNGSARRRAPHPFHGIGVMSPIAAKRHS